MKLQTGATFDLEAETCGPVSANERIEQFRNEHRPEPAGFSKVFKKVFHVAIVALAVWVCESDAMIVHPRDIRWRRDTQGRLYGVHFTDVECGHVHWVRRGGK